MKSWTLSSVHSGLHVLRMVGVFQVSVPTLTCTYGSLVALLIRLMSLPSKFTAFKIDEIDGLPESGLFAPFTVRMAIRGSELSRESNKGWSKWASTATVKTLDNIRKLHENKCEGSVIADVMDVDVDLITEFLRESSAWAQDSGKTKAEKEKHDLEWLEKLQENSNLRESSCNPQFEEVLTANLATKDVTAVVEVLNDPKKRPKKGEAASGVVARFEVKLGAQEVIHGPFILLDPRTNRALDKAPTLNGTFTLWRLEQASVKLEKLRAVTRMIGLGAKSHGLRKESDTRDGGAADSSSPSSETPMRKRDWFKAKMGKVFNFGRDSNDSLPSLPSLSSMSPVTNAAAAFSSATGVGIASRGKTRVEEAVEIIERGSTQMDALCGLGMLHGMRDWEQARHAYRRKYGGGNGTPPGKGEGDFIAALEVNLTDEADRHRAAHLLHVNGIGSGSWAPGRTTPATPRREKDEASCVRTCM